MINLKKLGNNHPDIAASYNNLGAAYDSKGNYERAIEYYEKSLAIRLKKLGSNHPDIAISYNSLGSAYYSKGNYDRAIEYYEKSLMISTAVVLLMTPAGLALFYGGMTRSKNVLNTMAMSLGAYAVGTLVGLLQDKLFLSQIARNKFKRQVSSLEEDFIIILGYNYTSSEILKIINDSETRVVVIESEQEKVDSLMLDNYTPHVFVLKANSYDAHTLELAGIKSKYCKAVVSLYKNDDLNLRIALASKMLNSHVTVVAKSTTPRHTSNLTDLDVEVVVNPFKIISSHINLALTAPNLLKIENINSDFKITINRPSYSKNEVVLDQTWTKLGPNLDQMQK